MAINTLLASTLKRVNDSRLRHSASRPTITVSAAIWPISTPTLKLRIRSRIPVESSPSGSCCKRVDRPKPCNRPKPNTIHSRFGERMPRCFWKPPLLSKAL